MCDIWVMCLLQITVMCVRVCICIWIWMWIRLSLCLYTFMMQHFVRMPVRNAFLCVCIWQGGDAFGRAPTLTHSVLIWCRVWRLSPYLMTRGRPCPFMMSENEERRVAECTESEAKHVFNPHTRAHRPQGLRWLSYLLTGEKPANCDQVCLCIFTFVWGIVRKVGLFWIPRLLLYC